MTGAYVRIYREGRWVSAEIETLSEAELAALAASQPERGWIWVAFLTRWIREHVQGGACRC
jgi:hypothetical protein